MGYPTSVVNVEVDFKKEIHLQRKRNAKEARLNRFIRDKSTNQKLIDYAKEWGYDIEKVIKKYETDPKFRIFFMKDPNKQSFHEKLQLDLIRGWVDKDFITDFYKVPNNEPLYVVDGELKDEKIDDSKNIDLLFSLGSCKFVSSLKHTNEKGGAQDNQYSDIKNFLRNCNKKDNGNTYFLAIVDGDYYTSKIGLLNEKFGSRNVKILSVNNLHEYLIQFLPEKIKSRYLI